MESININQNKEIDIRKAEDSLFKEWAKKRHPFATDGCADPKKYSKSDHKIVFVLKERNWGHSIDDQIELQVGGTVHIVEERDVFNSWWTLIAQWADVLLPDENGDGSWHKIQSSFVPSSKMAVEERTKWINERNKKALGKCACIQLKKAPGCGELNKQGLATVVKEDKDFILRQLAIYSPHFVISCGSNDNWTIFTNMLFEHAKINQTSNGINYFITKLGDNNHETAVINFGHPSMRVNSTLWGSLAFGLREALTEIYPQLMTAGL
jgi:hypothetical protein